LHRDYGDLSSFRLKPVQKNPFITVAEAQTANKTSLNYNQETNLRNTMKRFPSYKDGMRRVGQAYLCKGGNVGQGYHAYGLVPTLTKVWAHFLPIYFPHKNENIPNVNSKEFNPGRSYGDGSFRKASLRETLRLQGFPDNFVPPTKENLGYQQVGNAVNALVVKEIGQNLLYKILK
jgi:site-specific DNA-cytosine methylase